MIDKILLERYPRFKDFIGSSEDVEFFGQWCDFDADVTENQRLTVADAQTSGGLLIACREDRADELDAALEGGGALARARIGRFTSENPGRISLRPR